MKEKRNSKYAQREIKQALLNLQYNPEDKISSDRLAWWSAYLGDYETAWAHAVTDEVKEYIRQCETS